MNTASLLTTQYGILQRQFSATLKDLTLEQLQWQPVPEANSIGFLLWHILRTWDSYASLINNQDELYESDGWRERFGLDTRGRGVEGSDTGTEFAPEDVRIVKPQPETLLDYLMALSDQAERNLGDANDDNLSREMIVPWWPEPPTIARVHIHILAHSYIHLGEAQYLRGLIPE